MALILSELSNNKIVIINLDLGTYIDVCITHTHTHTHTFLNNLRENLLSYLRQQF